MRQSPSGDRSTKAGQVPSGDLGGRLRNLLLQQLAGFAAAPIIGLFAGFLLLFGGIFLAVAWMVGPQHLIDSYRYAAYSVPASGRIVESWAALEFNPSSLPKGKTYWQPYAKIQTCAVVAYAGDWGDDRRAFCGNRFDFADDFRLDDWRTMAPGVPFTFARDASGGLVPEIRMSRAAYDWLAKHPPHDTFMLPKPPPATALGALHDRLDAPLEYLVSGWTAPVAEFPLLLDSRHSDQALPAAIVAARRTAFQWPGLIFTVVFGAIGFYVWRLGVGLLTGTSGVLLWVICAASLLALPWWSDALPRIVRHANSDWADVVGSMLDDINRVTRFSASAPSDALLADGERVQWRVSEGRYADTFGRLQLAPPSPLPATPEAAREALSGQVAVQVRNLDSAHKAALFEKLRVLHDAFARDVQSVFCDAAEGTLRDAGADAAAHRAARDFLLFAAGKTYYENQLDTIEVAPN